MRTAMISIAVAAAVGVGVVGAIVAGPGGDAAPVTDGRPEQVAIELDPAATGPGCIGGLCQDALPQRIEYREISAYLKVLSDALIEDPSAETASNCHTMAHEIGRRAVGSASVPDLLDLDDGGCLYGYQHGVLEGWSIANDLQTLLVGIPTACDAYDKGSTLGGLGSGQIEYAKGSCAHGIGHAISLQAVGSVREAVSYCDGVGEGQIGGCAGGVFMAYASENPSQGGTAATLTLERGEVETLCAELTGEYQVECWSKLWLLGSRVGMTASHVAELCPADAASCARGVGEGLYYEKEMDAGAAIDACPATVGAGCVYGVAWAEANAWVGSGQPRDQYESICTPQRVTLRDEGEYEECVNSENSALNGGIR